jgi:hypothetical protein
MHSRALAIFLALSLNLTLAFAGAAGPAPDARTLVASLPASDAVIFVDLQRIMLEIIPRLLANDPAMLAKLMNAVIDLKAKSGVNILGIDSVVAGIHFVGKASHEMKKENVGIVVVVHGDFDANAVISFLKVETKGKVTEETYAGKLIYHEPQPVKKKSEREIPAMTVLDPNTLAVGDLPQVRATIDSFGGKDRIDPALVQLAARDSSSFVGMAGNVPASLLEELNSKPPGDPMEQALHKALMGLKQIFGSVGATPSDFNVITGARMGSAEQAASISDMLLGLRTMAGSQILDPRAKGLLESLQITSVGDEVQIKCDIKNEVVQAFVTSMLKDELPAVKKAVTTAKRTVRSRRGKRRRR